MNAHARVTRAIGRELAEAGLPDLAWYDLLWTLYRRPGRSLRVKELANEVVLSPTAMSRFVDRVEAAGYVRREADPEDRRALQVTLTDEGVDCCAACGRSTGEASSATSRLTSTPRRCARCSSGWGSAALACGSCAAP